jgi:hypothetical protein
MLNTIDYDGPISVEWEDAGMDRGHRANHPPSTGRRIPLT